MSFSEKYPSQKIIQQNVNLYTSDKAYDLNLSKSSMHQNFYAEFNRNGSHSLIFSQKGYLTSINNQKIDTDFEINLNEPISCAKFLHNERYIAVAHNNLFVYNNQGVEKHCVREIKNVQKMEFLPYHFLLSCYSENKLNYLDTSIGTIIGTVPTAKSITMASKDGIVYLGQRNGCVTLHSPKEQKYLMKIKCNQTISDISVNENNLYAVSNKLNIFDIRNTFSAIKSIHLRDLGVHSNCFMEVSQNGLIAIYSDRNITVLGNDCKVYLRHRSEQISNIRFCPYEDILMIGTKSGISNIVVPKSAYSTYDSREITPFMSLAEKRELEIKNLLEKIPPELIAFESVIGKLESKKKKKMPEKFERYFDQKNELQQNESVLSKIFKRSD